MYQVLVVQKGKFEMAQRPRCHGHIHMVPLVARNVCACGDAFCHYALITLMSSCEDVALCEEAKAISLRKNGDVHITPTTLR